MPTRDDYRKLEMEGLIAADIGRAGGGTGRFPWLLFGVAAVAILGWGFWRASGTGRAT